MAEMTLEDAVGEVLNHLTGFDLHYIAELDRFRSIARTLNRALRLVATEQEWGCYSAIEDMGELYDGQTEIRLRRSRRPRIILDDSVRLVDENDNIHMWAYFLPRESLHKYQGRTGLWVSSTENRIEFSRPIQGNLVGMRAFVPVMREPQQVVIPANLDSLEALEEDGEEDPLVVQKIVQLRNFHNPDIVEEWVVDETAAPYIYTSPESALEQLSLTPAQVRHQLIDHEFPDLIVLKAAFLYAGTDPLMQPRVQTLEGQYKDLFYALTERDSNHTDDPFMNQFTVPIQGSLNGGQGNHAHPHADERRYYNYR
jgi:hypothetical protein